MSHAGGTFLARTSDQEHRRAQMATRDTGGQQKATRTREETDEVEAAVDTEVAERHKEMTEDVDSILDEIDEVLEENSEEFVRQYVQKGGERLLTVVEAKRADTKRCPSCGETKSVAHFGRNRSPGAGLSFSCPACNRERSNAWYRQHRR